MFNIKPVQKNIKFKNFTLILFLALFVCGVVVGSVWSVSISSDDIAQIKLSLEKSINAQSRKAIMDFIPYVIIADGVLWSICMMLSMSHLTLPLCYLVALINGCSSGLSSAVVMNCYGIKGLLYSVMSILPSSIIKILLWYILIKICADNERAYSKKSMSLTRGNNNSFIILSIIILITIIFADMLNGSFALFVADVII